MTPLILGVSFYLFAGTLAFIFPLYRFWFSVVGWMGAVGGLVRATLLFLESGPIVQSLGSWAVLGIEIKIDQTTLLFGTLVVLINIFTLLDLRGRKQGFFYCLYNLLLGTCFSLAFSNDLFNLYVTIELMSLISILAIGYDRKAYQIYAGIKYLVLSSLSMSLYLIGLALLYSTHGYLGISELASVVPATPDSTVFLAVGLMITGLAVKSGTLLFSMWLPDAHSYCSTVVSALLSGLAVKCGLVGIIRVSEIVPCGFLLLELGALTGIGGAFYAVAARRPKRILAYHTMSQVGYILIGIGIGSSLALTAATLHILFHGLFKSLLFLSVGHTGVGNQSLYKLKKDRAIPLGSKVGLFAGSLCIMAIPPFNGYFSKGLLVEQAHRPWVWGVIMVTGLGTAFSFLKLNWKINFQTPSIGLSRDDLPLVSFAVVVLLTSLFAFSILGRGEFLTLLSPSHAIQRLVLTLFAGVAYWSLRSFLKSKQVSETPFTLDNSLISIFTGFAIISSGLLLF